MCNRFFLLFYVFFFILLYCNTKELIHIFSFLLNLMIFFIFISQSYYFYMYMDVKSPAHSLTHTPIVPKKRIKQKAEQKPEHGTRDGIITDVYTLPHTTSGHALLLNICCARLLQCSCSARSSTSGPQAAAVNTCADSPRCSRFLISEQ